MLSVNYQIAAIEEISQSLQQQESSNNQIEGDISESIEVHEMIEEASKVIKERAAKKKEEEKLQ